MPLDPVALTADLVRCPSVTPAEGGALELLGRVLRDIGFRVERPVFSAPGTPDIENLFATIGQGAPHFVFAGHTDVVPPGDPARWRHEPFSGRIEGGELHGRGAVDMKGAIACFVAAASAFLDERRLPGTISLLITGDEEGPAINGTGKLLAWARDRGERFDHCLLGEPTNPDALGDMIKNGRRGSLSGTLIVEGRQGHVAYPHLADNPARGLLRIAAALLDPPLDEGSPDFDPSNLEIVAIDTGNPAFNVIPAEMRARFNIRFNDRWTPATLRAEIERRCAAAAGAARWRIVFEPSTADVFVTPPGGFVDLVAGAVETVTGRRPRLSTTGGTSDARFIKDYCPVIEFGLVGRTMHQVDERVAVDDLARLTAVYRAILDRYFAASP